MKNGLTPPRLGLAVLSIAFVLPGTAPADGQPHDRQQEKRAHAERPKLTDVSPVAVVPFVGLLLSIAFLPLFAEHFWHSNRNRAIVSVAFAAPIVAYLLYLQFGAGQPGLHALTESLHEYASFIILLGALYTVSGGIVVNLNVRPHPLINGGMLAVGAVLANVIGTTGASMLLIRPYLRINQSRSQAGHLPIFFIFMVSNLGGLLTPLGDPPLFLGFLRGVSFFWTLRLWPQWLMANSITLLIFLVWDGVQFYRDPQREKGKRKREKGIGGAAVRAFRFRGWINVALLGGVVAAVLLKSVIPSPWNGYASEVMMVLMAVLSLWLTPKRMRVENIFGWAAILEVAVLFIGIFITMAPALAILDQHGKSFGITDPWHFFWLTGALSGFLDNAPTYVTFATLAAEGHNLGWLMHNRPGLLEAVSCGAVFMGAMSYIGNGPNFMVKAIAEEAGYRTPSFFGYLLHSTLILGPVFLLVTFLFFA